MQPSRIAQLLQPFLLPAAQPLSEKDLSDISIYIDILQRWNARINLTAIRNEEEIVTRHFGESLFAACQLFPNRRYPAETSFSAHPNVADVGSGAGFPGLPIKLWAREIVLTLIESNHRKVAFLREATRALTLADINVLDIRAEDVHQKFDFVTLRAVERFEEALPIASQLLSPSGQLALLISNSQGRQAQDKVQLHWQPPLPIPESSSRILLIGRREPTK